MIIAGHGLRAFESVSSAPQASRGSGVCRASWTAIAGTNGSWAPIVSVAAPECGGCVSEKRPTKERPFKRHVIIRENPTLPSTRRTIVRYPPGEPLKAEGSHPRANFGRPRNRHASVAGTTGTLGLAIAQKQVCSKTTFELPVERGRQRDQIAKLIFFCGRPHAPAPTRPVSLALLTYRGQFRSPLAAPSTSDTISNSNALSIRDLLPRFPFFLGDRKIQPDNAPLSAVCAFCAFDSVT